MPAQLKSLLATAAVAVLIAFQTGSAFSQAIQERTIRWGHLNNTDHPVSKGVQKFVEIVAAKSGGKLKVREFPANQLGSEMQQQSALRGHPGNAVAGDDIAGWHRQRVRLDRLPL